MSLLKSMREYRVWTNMKTRCYNSRHAAYKYYGARGIEVCGQWRDDFWVFLADMGRCPAGLSIERIDGNGNYEPLNCIWADAITQANNRSGVDLIAFNEKTLSLAAWARELGVTESRLRTRLRLGWTIERAFNSIKIPPNKLTLDQVAEIRILLQRGLTHERIGEQFKVNRSTITAIGRGRNWRDAARPRVELAIQVLTAPQASLFQEKEEGVLV